MESIRISVHEAKIFAALKSTDQCWLTNQEISARIKDVQLRTIRLHTNKLAKLGLLEQAELFPGYKYRVSDKAQQRNPKYLVRLAEAAKLHGISRNIGCRSSWEDGRSTMFLGISLQRRERNIAISFGKQRSAFAGTKRSRR